MSKFQRIFYQRNFRISEFLYETIGAGILLEQGQDAKEALNECKALVNEYHNENMIISLEHQERYIPDDKLPEIQVEKEIREQTLEEQMASCTEIKVLESYKFIAKKDPELQLAYDKKMYILKLENKKIWGIRQKNNQSLNY